MAPAVSVSGGPIMVDVAFRREYLGERAVLLERHAPNLKAGGLTCCVLPVDDLDDFKHFFSEIEEADGQLRQVDSADRLPCRSEESSVGFILCGSFQSIGSDLRLISVFQRLGMRMFSLSLNRRNLIADGCSERTQSGLSHYGIDVVRELAYRRIMIDVSHLSEAAFWDVLDAVDVPIIASHSNAKAVCEHPRNLSDAQFDALARRGGIVGLSMHPTMVSKDKPIAANVIDHLDHMVGIMGPEHIAIGTDYIDHVIDFFRHKLVSGDPSGELYGGDHMYPEGIETVARLGRLSEVMSERGYPQDAIEKFQWKNFARFWATIQT